ncbi:hypothetical protein KI659_15360 [Litoribacter alkaliphilus]|uniref:Lipoprotein n=1 Tax=Litoribacter ruber TaxID=702568 RepID=A0AAP2G286_9BACT|nr:hypothetical protein [Litoribacter alkaliphilus]MBS9525397.1 hypothetical protein [Litoribacter alkaliphilus]
MKLNTKTLSILTSSLLIAGVSCTADHAYKTSISGKEEVVVNQYEGTFFKEVDENSIITVRLQEDRIFDAAKFQESLNETGQESRQVAVEQNENDDDDENDVQAASMDRKSDKMDAKLIGASQNRTANNPWISLNDSISYRITHLYHDNELHLKAFYINHKDSEFPKSGRVISQNRAQEQNLMPAWNHMMSLARQYGNNVTTR